MKYLVSDTQKLPNKYGKWYWYTDDACKTFQNDEHLVIYAGYVIGKETIDEVIARNPHELDKANGCYFVVILTKNTAKVVLDYFCSTKHWWRNNGRVEFTNAIFGQSCSDNMFLHPGGVVPGHAMSWLHVPCQA